MDTKNPPFARVSAESPGVAVWLGCFKLGRVAVNAEGLCDPDMSCRLALASMGPRSCERGRSAGLTSLLPVTESEDCERLPISLAHRIERTRKG
jgi:hypothetical protein